MSLPFILFGYTYHMKEKESERISQRLASILSKLNAEKSLSVEELAQDFNVSSRTIQRDLNERFNFLPLEKKQGFYTLPSYHLAKLSFEDIKNFATLSGIKALYPTMKDNFIVDILDPKFNDTYLVKGFSYENTAQREDEFKIIHQAIQNHQQLSFLYNHKIRTVKPYKLVNINGIWYLSADENKQLKTYTFTKILQLSLTEEYFEAEDKFIKIIQDNQATWFSETMIEVILEVDISVSEYFIRRPLLPNQKILEKKKDKLILSTHISYDEEILKTIRYWLPHIRIISPKYLQKKLFEGLYAYLDDESVLHDTS